MKVSSLPKGCELLTCLIVLMHKNAFFAISIDLKAKGKKLNEKRILRCFKRVTNTSQLNAGCRGNTNRQRLACLAS